MRFFTFCKQHYTTYTYALLFLLFFITEGYFKVLDFSFGQEPKILQYTKATVFILGVLFLAYKAPKFFLTLCLLCLCFCMGQSRLTTGFSFSVIVAFIKQLYPIVLLAAIHALKPSKKALEKLFCFFEYVMLCNSMLVLVAVIFGFSAFRSYPFYRFGYNGLLVSSAVSTYVYSLTLFYMVVKYQRRFFNTIKPWIILLAALCVGTKGLYLFIGLFVTGYIWRYTTISKRIVVAIFSVLGVGVLYYFFFCNGLFSGIREQDGLLSAVFSFRDRLFLEHTLPYIQKHWHFLNYCFGGVSDLTTRSQTEIIDIFYFFGCIGGILYFRLFYKVFLTFRLNFYRSFLLAVLLIIVFLAGNFFSYPSIAIYLVMLQQYILYHDNKPSTPVKHTY